MSDEARRWYEKAKLKLAELGLSCSDLAEQLSARGIDTAKSTVGAWMIGRNEPPLATIKVIGEIIGLNVSELVGEDVFFVCDPKVRAVVERLSILTDDEMEAVLKLLGIPKP